MTKEKITTPAPRRNMRYNEVMQWLMENGYTHYEVRRMMEQGVIEAHFLRPTARRAWFNAAQIKEAIDGNRVKENNSQ